jgi:hypothetical protein
MEHPVERIGSTNVKLLCLRIEALEAAFLTVLVVEVEQYRIESLASDPGCQRGYDGGFPNASFTSLGE